MGKDSPLLPAKPQNIQRNQPGFSRTLRLAGWDPLILTETRALPREPVPLESLGPPRHLARCPGHHCQGERALHPQAQPLHTCPLCSLGQEWHSPMFRDRGLEQ